MQKNSVMLMKGTFYVLVFLSTAFLPTGCTNSPKQETVQEIIPQKPEEVKSLTVEGKPYMNCLVDSGFVKPNQRLADLLKGYKIEEAVWRELTLLPRDVFNCANIRPGQKYTVIYADDSIKAARHLVFEPNPYCYYIFDFCTPLKVEKIDRKVEVEEKIITAEIKNNLWETIEAMKIPAGLCNKFVDIFDWRVDFQRLQPGNRLKIIYTQQLVNGKRISFDQIKAACFEYGEKTLYAFGHSTGGELKYYDEDGRSCQAQLLKYPIEFSRISSRYSHRRFHPVAKVFRPHLGTDFAAPVGTPIRTVGDGVVLEAGYTGNNGNYVKIMHNRTYTTGYLHMSRIGKGMHSGAHVKQGQVIGYVGSTGLATGPHLCYRFWKNGRQVDALRVDLPRKEKLSEIELEKFGRNKMALVSRLDLAPYPNQTKLVAQVESKSAVSTP